MNVEIAVTKTCHHCPLIEAELKKSGIPYSIRYVEDDVELQKKHNIMGSPNILVDGELIFRGMPAITAYHRYHQEKLRCRPARSGRGGYEDRKSARRFLEEAF